MKFIFLVLVVFSKQANASMLGQFFSSSSSTGAGYVTFDRDSTWVVPTGVTKINVQITGAGGGGSTGSTNGAGGGGGGGSCIKNGASVLASANGGRGAHSTENFGQRGSVTQTSLTVTAGSTLNIYLGGGGGAAGHYPYTSVGYSGGGGGYGPCGTGGAGGNASSVSGGTSGNNLGGGGGAGYDMTSGLVGGNATTTSGNSGGHNGGAGGAALVGGNPSHGGGGGASGGVGGNGLFYSYNAVPHIYSISAKAGSYASNTAVIDGYFGTTTPVMNCGLIYTHAAGNAGFRSTCSNSITYSTGGAGGSVAISW